MCVSLCVRSGGGAASGRFPVNTDLCDRTASAFILTDNATWVRQEESEGLLVETLADAGSRSP